jgi:hypothetical protein
VTRICNIFLSISIVIPIFAAYLDKNENKNPIPIGGLAAWNNSRLGCSGLSLSNTIQASGRVVTDNRSERR